MRFGLFATYVSYDVYLKKDRVEFISRPKNSVKMPLVQYSDIAAIKVKKVFFLVPYVFGRLYLAGL